MTLFVENGLILMPLGRALALKPTFSSGSVTLFLIDEYFFHLLFLFSASLISSLGVRWVFKAFYGIF